MPCDQVRTTTLALGKVDAGMMKAALQALGFTRIELHAERLSFSHGTRSCAGRLDLRTGRLTMTGNQPLAENEVRRAYSTEVVRATARRFGWTLTQTAAGQFEAVRGSY